LAIVAVIVPPAFAVVALTVTVGGVPVTVMVALVASRVVESFKKKRTLYVPGVVGIVNATVALDIPVAGLVRVPFR